MSYTERLLERLEIASAVGITGTVAATVTSGTADMADARRALLVAIGQGTGTAGITVEAGTITYGTSTAGYTSGNIPTWATLTGGTCTSGATHTLTSGEVKTIEVLAEHMPTGARYLRALLGYAEGTDTYASLVLIADINRTVPPANSAITEEKQV